VIFIGHRRLNNMYFHLPTTAYAATFCLYNNYLIFFILLNKTDRYYALKDILYQI
jgi:hypothetical protein